MSQAQCFHCKKTVLVAEPELIRTKNERLRLAGKCSDCGKSVSQFVQDPERPQLTPEQKKEREEKRREERKKTKTPSPESPKKSIKKRALKPCASCSCKQHQEVLDSSPSKKKKRVSQKEKREKQIQELLEENEKLKSQIPAVEAVMEVSA
jgi:hypothetical protein